MTELQRDTLAYGVVAAASAYLLIWIIPAMPTASRGPWWSRLSWPTTSGWDG